MEGFVYERDESAVRDAERELDKQKFSNQIADLNDVADDLKNLSKISNIYDFFGVKLTDSLSGLDIYNAIDSLHLGDYIADSINLSLDSMVDTIRTSLAGRQKYTDNVMANGGYSANYNIEIGDIVLEGVHNTEQLAEAIHLNLSAALTQQLYSNR